MRKARDVTERIALASLIQEPAVLRTGRIFCAAINYLTDAEEAGRVSGFEAPRRA